MTPVRAGSLNICSEFVYVCALLLSFSSNVPPVRGALMFSPHSSGCFWCGKAPGFYFPPLQVRRGAQVLSYFCRQSSEVCAATELAEERRSFAFRRASLSYFTLILSDSHAVGFIVRRAFLELLPQAFL